MGKQLIKLINYGTNIDNIPDCTGRLLGVITDKLFSQVKRDKEAAAKVLTSETVTVGQAVAALEAVDLIKDGARIAIALTSRDTDKDLHGKLFVTPRVTSLNSYMSGKSASLNASTDLWFRIEVLEE